MTTRTGKTTGASTRAASKKITSPRTKDKRENPVTDTAAAIDETNVIVQAEDQPKKRGRKPSPFTAVIRRFEKAKKELERAQQAADKVKAAGERLDAAKAEYKAASDELQSVIGDLPAASAE